MSKEADFSNLNISIQRDKYSERREGKSNVYEIACANCDTPLMIYQKDGKGSLIRCYVDRIFAIDNIEGLNKDEDESNPEVDLNQINNITCNNCHTLIGTSMIYKPEKRPAFHMIKGAFSRKPYKPTKNE